MNTTTNYDDDLGFTQQAQPNRIQNQRAGAGVVNRDEALSVAEVPGSGLGAAAHDGAGESSGFGGAISQDDDVQNAAGESGEEGLEARFDQLLASPVPENNAESDLEAIDGFESADERAVAAIGKESAAASDVWLPEAGGETATAPEGAEFLPILAKLGASLAIPAGQALIGAIRRKLSPKTQRRLQGLLTTPLRTGAALLQGGIGGQLRGLAGQLLQPVRSALRGGEAGLESAVDEAMVEEAVAVLEVIIGSDDRVRIHKTTEVPWRRICALRITFKNGSVYRGTGFFIGPRTVATAGHCVYLHNQGGWAQKIEVIPGANGAARPFGAVTASSFRSVTGWVQSKLPDSDYGCIVLPQGSFASGGLGSFGFASLSAPALLAQPAVVAGYPGDKPFAELWGMSRKIKSVTAKTLIYDIDTMGGQSGAPVYIKQNGQRQVVGIHNYGSQSGNSATRVTPAVFARLQAWSQL
jgi:V8-like Glu-specific endopeptidase